MQTPVTANFKKNILTKIPEGYYPLMEKFYTIQGEGYHTGKPAFLSDLPVVMLVVFGAMLKIRGRHQLQILLLLMTC